MIVLVSSISYTDLSLSKEFSKNVSLSNIYKLPSQSAVQMISMSTDIGMAKDLFHDNEIVFEQVIKANHDCSLH